MSLEKSPFDATPDAAMEGGALDQEARDAIARLGEHDLQKIDQAILSSLGREWKKAGFITAGVMIAAPDEYEDLPESEAGYRIAVAGLHRRHVRGFARRARAVAGQPPRAAGALRDALIQVADHTASS